MADPNFELIKEYNIPTVSLEDSVGQINTTLNKIWSIFEKAGNGIVSVVDAFVNNWKIAIIGLVALAVWLKD